MMTAPTMDKTNQSYDKAIESLKQINNKLFYNELNQNLQDYYESMNAEYEKTKKLITEVDYIVQGMPVNLELKMDELTKNLTYSQEQELESMKANLLTALDQKKTEFMFLMKKLGQFYTEMNKFFSENKTSMEAHISHIDDTLLLYKTTLSDQQVEFTRLTEDLVKTIEALGHEMSERQLKALSENRSEILEKIAEYKIQQEAFIEEKIESITTRIDELIEAVSSVGNQLTSFQTEVLQEQNKLGDTFQATLELHAENQSKQQLELEEKILERLELQQKQHEQKNRKNTKLWVAVTIGQTLLIIAGVLFL